MNILKSLKKDSKGFGHIETILIVLVVAVIAGVGYFVYQAHGNKPIKPTAHAGSYKLLASSSGSGGPYVWGCKVVGAGGYFEPRITITKSALTYGGYYNMIAGDSKGNTVGPHLFGSAYWGNTTASLTMPLWFGWGSQAQIINVWGMYGAPAGILSYDTGTMNAWPAC